MAGLRRRAHAARGGGCAGTYLELLPSGISAIAWNNFPQFRHEFVKISANNNRYLCAAFFEVNNVCTLLRRSTPHLSNFLQSFSGRQSIQPKTGQVSRQVQRSSDDARRQAALRRELAGADGLQSLAAVVRKRFFLGGRCKYWSCFFKKTFLNVLLKKSFFSQHSK